MRKTQFIGPRRKKRSGAERIRAPPLPQQQPHQHPHNEDDDKFWQIYRSESKPLKYPKECINFGFGSLSEYGKERGDNFIRYATVKLLFLKWEPKFSGSQEGQKPADNFSKPTHLVPAHREAAKVINQKTNNILKHVGLLVTFIFLEIFFWFAANHLTRGAPK